MFKTPTTMIFSHWNTMIQGLTVSPKEFLAAVERVVASKQMSDSKHSRVDWKEGGIISAKREYLRIRRKNHSFDICGAPFGNGFFVSWWLGETPSLFWRFLMSIPVVGPLSERFLRPVTYFQIDTMNMFQSLVHGAVLEVVDGLTQTNGLKALAETERKPVVRDFFKK